MHAIDLQQLSFDYGDRLALDGLSLQVSPGQVFGLLGPNGSGKTTLFRILSTTIPVPPGKARIFDADVATEQAAVRRMIGVVFQSPSLDKQLTARENLRHHGHLYGLKGADLTRRIDALLHSFDLGDRADERVGAFSGGMRRRVEVAKSLLHQPRLLLMDEPSTGLDPGARLDLAAIIQRVSRAEGVTVLITTHLMEEADKCDWLAILAQGRLLAADTPQQLKSQVGGDVISLTTQDPDRLAGLIGERLQFEPQRLGNVLRLELPNAHQEVPRLIEASDGLVDSVSVSKPSLEDVFIRLTGRRLTDDSPPSHQSG